MDKIFLYELTKDVVINICQVAAVDKLEDSIYGLHSIEVTLNSGRVFSITSNCQNDIRERYKEVLGCWQTHCT